MPPELLLLLFSASGVFSFCPWELPGLQKWSSLDTWDGVPPQDEEVVTITKPVLLDTHTPRLRLLDIRDGGMIVFSPNDHVKLTSEVVRIKHNGSLLIGSPECRYLGEAEIMLTGVQGPDVSMGEYTKGIYVKEGGNLDIHGEHKLAWTKLAETLQPQENAQASQQYYELKLVDEPFGWKAGDKIVIASTDYDMHQAEEMEIVECPPCHLFCTCTVRGELKYSHYGEIYKKVDMRAEVGLLTRNIKIYGEVKDENDTYGGHIKAYEGFETYRIRGAELTKMGQKGITGRYPIHFHMLKEVDSNKAYAVENSIHHLFQRCITVHGTHGTKVVNNVAYHTFGHCYFLEDGGEKNNTYHHNLGLVTQAGPTIPSDRMPATFWITSPLTTLTENSAAGSDGMGIWFIFAENVTGPSADEGFFARGEAFRTAITKFESNTVHSNVDTGFMFGHELLADQDFNGPGGTDKCNPREDPLDPHSEPATNFITSLTAFKNIKQNVWNDCRNTTWNGYKSADALLGLTMKHDNNLLNSIFIGESTNIGEPNMVRLRNGTNVMWHRSTAKENGGAILGLQLYDGNPYVDGTSFADFYDDEYKVAGAIGFRKPHAGVIPTLFRNNYFDFKDNLEGNYIKGLPRGSFGGQQSTARMGLVLDWDGTITGYPKSTVVRDEPFFTSTWCEPHPHWGNMSVCPHRYSEDAGSGGGYSKIDLVITRDDVPEHPEVALEFHDPWHPYLSTDHSYIYSFRNNSLPSKYHFALHGLDSGNSQLVGFCVPLHATAQQLTFKGEPKPVEQETYEDLLNDKSGAGYFWDKEVGVVFRRFQVDEMRTPDDKQACVPSTNYGKCPIFRIETGAGTMGDTDCRDRAYPKYQKDPL